MRTELLAVIWLFLALPAVVWADAVASQPVSPSIQAVVAGRTAFAADLYAKLAPATKGNLFFSPGSIDTALAMTYAGARGPTAEQMAKTLHVTLPTDQLSRSLADLLGVLHNPARTLVHDDRRPPKEQPAYQLLVANALWGQQGYIFNPEFTQLVQKRYGAGLNLVDFGQPEQARTTINQWVATQTKDKIKDLLAQGTLDRETRLVLTNAIYFKSHWLETFAKEATKDGPFQVTATETVQAPLMHMEHRLGYSENDELQVLELPYASHELSMLVLLPKKVGGLGELEKHLTADTLTKWLKDMKPAFVEVTLPKFTFASEFGLGDTLKALGMTLAFDPSKADFSGMTTKEQMFISAVVHKAFVAVDEAGTEAAAATAVVMVPTAMPLPQSPKVFTADHPFVFLIRHNATGDLLFWGRVADPTSK